MMKRLIWTNDLYDREKVMEEWRLDEEDYESLRSCWSYDNAFCDLNIVIPTNIVVFADLGLWNGRENGMKELGKNIAQCLQSECDYVTWYIDRYDLKCDAVHHDGTNHYLYRAWKENISEAQKMNFMEKFCEGKVTRQDITRYTMSLVGFINKRFEGVEEVA